MKLQIHRGRRGASPRGTTAVRRGFALIVTLSLMILLTVIAVGLLTLSTINLRSSSQGDAQQVARANARVALMLAIGDLQKQLGPDTRISVTADQTATSDPAASSTPQTQHQWAGAYKAWPAGLPADARPNPEFLQWFVSGDPKSVTAKNFADTAVSGKSVDIVTSKTVGTTGDPVRVPLLMQTLSNGTKNNLAWWVSDLGTKALVAPAKDTPSAIAEVRADLQAAPSYNLKNALAGTTKPFESLVATDTRLSRIPSWQSSALLADKPENIRGLYHDFTTQSRGLLTNVRAGGFRKDLSAELERASSNAPQSASTALYKVGGETGINLQELWVYYNLYKEIRRSGSAAFTTGGSISSGSPYLMLESSPALCQTDDEFHMKQPVVVSYQLALSFSTIPTTVNGQAMNRLQLVADPIITLWNPLDIPVVVPSGTYFTVKYWQVPYDLYIAKNGGAFVKYPLAAAMSSATITDTTKTNGDGNYLSLVVGQLQQLVFKPGEVIKLSQSGNLVAKSAIGDVHKLGGKSGFNYGGGVSMPMRDLSGATIDLGANDVITYKAVPNNLTAGATSSSGHALVGTANHTRHFSLTHHEYYVGDDRSTRSDGGDTGTSLGIGGMFIDWDFGNRRLKFGEDRGATSPGIAGTKPAGERMYADNVKFKDIFRTLEGADTRELPVSILSAAKQPFMLFSFNAKTEKGTKTGTRFLSRFNPRALHMDFYDLSAAERDLVPYEYTIEPLLSWKNNKLEVSSRGNAYFGGGMDATDGASYVTTHSVPREPLVSLAAFQHSFANGFDVQKPKYGYGTLNAREPMMPQIAHAIGNSVACPALAAGSTTGNLGGGRPLADHSYLANQALWDDWFLSGITPQSVAGFSKSRAQRTVATEFFNGTSKLPVIRYSPNLRGQDPAKIANTYYASSSPSNAATLNIASFIQVDGMFNVNSTSIEAWKSLLGALRDRQAVVRDGNGKESIKSATGDTPVSALRSPLDVIAKGSGSVDVQNPDQWVGRRTLSDSEIDALARSIVKQVRKRGPFLSLADFVNRRVGSDKELARSGAIQSALDANDNDVNGAYRSAGRSVGSAASSRFTFPEAEQGPLAYGSPGIVKQADILTPIAPILSARSDSFMIRAYGEKTDANGKVLARAWCEAVVQRSPEFVDPTDQPEKAYGSINTLNKTFGRRFDIVSFRWLDASEA